MKSRLPQSPTDAARAYLEPRSALAAFEVAIEAREGAFVRISATAEGTPALCGYLRESAGVWEVLGFGSHFEAAFYERHRVPAALRR